MSCKKSRIPNKPARRRGGYDGQQATLDEAERMVDVLVAHACHIAILTGRVLWQLVSFLLAVCLTKAGERKK